MLVSPEVLAARTAARTTEDADPQETQEWLDSLEAVVRHQGPERAKFLLETLIHVVAQGGARLPSAITTPYVNTIPVEDQPGRGFGLDRVQWDAYMMSDARGSEGVVVDLLEWKVPQPTGAPPAVLNQLGFARLCFLAADLDERHARVQAAGIPCFTAPVSAGITALP